jgi:acetate kinase
MKILVINAGSSSLKFTLFSITKEEVLAKGVYERIGLAEPHLIYKRGDLKVEESTPIANHAEGLKVICGKLLDPKVGVLKSLTEVKAIGHRVLHGGEAATKPSLVDDRIKGIIKDCIPLGPLHNPANLACIEACQEIFSGIPNVAIFDTAFHQTMPPEAYLYAVPYELYTKYGIRKYGFHGTSHQFVSKATAQFLGVPLTSVNIITCHLGNGCSMAAVCKGQVIDTSMGLTPLEGLMMGTRSGDLDPAVVIRLSELGYSPAKLDKLLNKESGLLGVAGIGSSDMRDVIDAAKKGDKQADRALKMFVLRVVKYIGAYYTLLNGADVIAFTGGIGEYSAYIRGLILDKLGSLDLFPHKEKNEACLGVSGIISSLNSKWKAIVMPTNEELMIARQTMDVVSQEDKTAPAFSTRTATVKRSDLE